ncbi:MAG: hypothetical protein AAGK04_02770 [Planctomycetota bacterium]
MGLFKTHNELRERFIHEMSRQQIVARHGDLENVRHLAIGVDGPSLAMALLVLGPLIATLMTKYYYLALTETQLLAVRVAGPTHPRPKSIQRYDLDRLTGVAVRTRGDEVTMQFAQGPHPFSARFSRKLLKKRNGEEIVAIAEELRLLYAPIPGAPDPHALSTPATPTIANSPTSSI